MFRIESGTRTILECRGPDARRFLNGQVTQDVGMVADGLVTLPACVTDAKGRLQFRVWITALSPECFLIDGPADPEGSLESRLTRYLIADDVEFTDRTDDWRIVHFTDDPGTSPDGVLARRSSRFSASGVDWWIPRGFLPTADLPGTLLEGDALEDHRIRHGIPTEGRELVDGVLPPEAGLDASDISYSKGCYIGQEVISRIKSAGKVNQRLVRMTLDACVEPASMEMIDAAGRSAGRITSLSPLAHDGLRHLLAYRKRSAEGELMVCGADGERHPLHLAD